MTVLYTRQARFVTDIETASGDGVSVPAVREFVYSVNNCKAHVAAPFLIESMWPGAAPDLRSTDSSTDEKIIHRFVAREVPDGYNHIHWAIGGLMNAGAGGGTSTAWRLYSSIAPYVGPEVFDTSFLGQTFDVESIEINPTTPYPAGNIDLDLIKAANDFCYLTLTAQNSSASSPDYSRLSHIVARAFINS